jgi:hypothetical protein
MHLEISFYLPDCFTAVFTHSQLWFASFLREELQRIFCIGHFCLWRFYANVLSTAKSATVSLKSSLGSTFSSCLYLPFSLSDSLWLVVPTHKVPHGRCTPDPLGKPHGDVLVLFYSPAVRGLTQASNIFQAPRARITSLRLLLLVGPSNICFCDEAWGFLGLLCTPGWFLPLHVAILG